ncbi:MAG: tyrosine-type recombinase/integrase [Caldilineaceae bacterium]
MLEQSTPLSDVLELFILDCQAQSFTHHTIRFYKERLTLFVGWLDEEQGVLDLRDVTSNHIKQYFVSLRSRNLSSSYVHSHGRAIRSFLNYSVRDGLLAKSPFEGVKMPRLERKILASLSDDEAQKILEACTLVRDKAIFLMLTDSGLRASELATLDVGDVQMGTGAVTVRLGKRQKDRTSFVGAKTRKQLRLYLMQRGKVQNADPLFISERGGERLTYSGVAQLMKRLRKKTGIKHLSAHTCRRTFAINCLRNGMDLFMLARLMGHEDIAILRPYLEIINDDLEEAHSKFGPIDNML